MTEQIRYTKIYQEDLALGTGTEEVTLADGQVVALHQIDIEDLTKIIATGSSVPRSLADWMADCINVAGYAATQAGYAEAVADAYAAGKTVYWPAGTYVTTATIPNFHDVRHHGPGIVQRVIDLFYPDPSLHPGVTNILYVATTGSDTNDGLSSSEPRLTLQSMGNVIYTYNYGDVTWKIKFAAGTYSTQCSFSRPFPTPNYTYFLGVVKANGTVPTVIFNAPSNGVHGLYFQNAVIARVEDIKFTNYTSTGTPIANNEVTGLMADAHCLLYTRNVWGDGNDCTISVVTSSQARIEAGKHGATTANGCAVLCYRHSFVSVGYLGSVADSSGATGVAVIGGGYGIFSKEWSMNHVDYCYFSGQTEAGIFIQTCSRINATDCSLNSCFVGIDARSLSIVGMTAGTTFTSCTTDVAHRGNSVTVGDKYTNDTDISASTKRVSTGGETQSATPVTVYTKAFAGNELQVRGCGFRLRLYGEVTGTANTKTITVTFGSTILLTATIAAATTDYEVQVDLFQVTPATQQRMFTRIHQNGTLPVYNSGSLTEDTTAARTLTVTHSVTNTADKNIINFIELEIGH